MNLWILSLLVVIFAIPLQADSRRRSLPIRFPDGTMVEAEAVYTNEDRARGLMNRSYLAPNAGMLFLFKDLDIYGFWMKNTLIPLDLIWINERKEVVYWVTADPCKKDPCQSYVPMQKSRYVLEVNGGFAKKHGLKLGAVLEFYVPPEMEEQIEDK